MMFSKKLLQLRKSQNLQQTDLAKIIGCSDRSISIWERGLGTPSTDIVIKIANYFNVSTDFLLTNENNTIEKKDKNIISIQRAYNKLNCCDQKKMIEMNKLMFEDAFADEDNDDDTI